MKAKHLVIDTAAFVKNLPIWEYGEKLYSIPDVTREIRDKQTKQWYDSLPVSVIMREPQPWAIGFINSFSKKTGDFASLSLADVKLLALTYELEIEEKGSAHHLRTEPERPLTEAPLLKEKYNLEGFHEPSAKSDCSVIKPSDNLCQNMSIDEESSSSNSSSPTLPPYRYCVEKNSANSRQIPEIKIYWCHMLGLEYFLTDHSYVGGYSPNSDDNKVWGILVKEYPQFCPSPEEQYASIISALNLLPTETVGPLHSTFPCIRRWSYHIASFSKENRINFPFSDRKLDDILHDFEEMAYIGQESDCPVPELIGRSSSLVDSAVVVDMNSLSLDDQDTTEDGGDQVEKTYEKGDDNSILEDESCHYDGDCEGDDDITNEIHLEVENKEQDTNDGGVHDDEGWITPSNIKYHRLRNNENIPASQCRDGSVLVACITADFAMQNTLRHIGLSVMGVDGKLIWQIRTFILRCYACFKTTSDMAKLFCPNCGNKTLKRVSVTVNPDGTQKIWINYKKPINTRGMIFSLPKPRGGQHARNPILVADQKEVRLFSSKMSKKKVNPLHEDYDPDAMPFAIRDVYSRASQLGYIGGKCHNHYYWERKNPNVHVKKYKKKK